MRHSKPAALVVRDSLRPTLSYASSQTRHRSIIRRSLQEITRQSSTAETRERCYPVTSCLALLRLKARLSQLQRGPGKYPHVRFVVRHSGLYSQRALDWTSHGDAGLTSYVTIAIARWPLAPVSPRPQVAPR